MSHSAAPFVRDHKTRLNHATDMLIALIPALIWSVYIFGARVITICSVCAVFCFGFDYLIKRFIMREPALRRLDPYNAVYGILAAFTLPVTAPMWMPVLTALFTVFAKNLCYPGGRRIFNPYIFAAAVNQLLFRGTVTVFTRPLAYFNAFTFSLDEKLVSGYRVISPLQQMADGSVYEDGVIPQLVGYASGAIGEIAVTAMILGLGWMLIRGRAKLHGTLTFIAVIFVLAYIFPSDDAETVYYVFSLMFTGAITLIAVFALNDGMTTPLTGTGLVIAGAFCGVIVFVGRKFGGGFEWGYYAVLAVNVFAPVLEKYTSPRILGAPKQRKKKA